LEKYYQILGLSAQASWPEVKKAYRRLAKKYHPDRYGGDDKRFLSILEAYEVLKDLQKEDPYQRLVRDYQEAEQAYDDLVHLARQHARRKARMRAAYFRKKREQEQEQEYARGLRYLGIIVLSIAILFLGYKGLTSLMLGFNTRVATAHVVGLGQNRMRYQFQVGEQLRTEERYVRGYQYQMLAGNGLPLKVGDQFTVLFNAERPFFHRIDFEQVHFTTVQRYLLATQGKLTDYYRQDAPQLAEADLERQARCMAAMLYRDFGVEGLRKAYFYDAHPLENWGANRWTWRILSRKRRFKRLENQCRSGGPSPRDHD